MPSRSNRKRLLTFAVAGISALIAEHALKPYMKGKLKV